jgi:hypothetical protein
VRSRRATAKGTFAYRIVTVRNDLQN